MKIYMAPLGLPKRETENEPAPIEVPVEIPAPVREPERPMVPA